MNIPAFLTERLTAQYGEETARRIAVGFEAGRKTTLRVNRLKAEPAQIAAALADAARALERGCAGARRRGRGRGGRPADV